MASKTPLRAQSENEICRLLNPIVARRSSNECAFVFIANHVDDGGRCDAL
jgi:hypothetical protein